MNGAESLVRTAAAAGIDVCFANPGTTEMPLVAALDAVPGVRAILGLFEGVCTGAADGYARMSGRPAMTLLHLGPGFANGIANLHNARRARSPVVNVVGDHATWHLAADAPLTSDIVSLARPVSTWVRTTERAADLGGDLADAVAAARRPPGGVATLIAPADCQWDAVDGSGAAPKIEAPASVSETAVEEAARALSAGASAILYLGGAALGVRALEGAGRIAAATGCRVVHETFAARLERGAGRPTFERLPYFPEHAIESLRGAESLVLAGSPEPVAFFGYPKLPSRLAPGECGIHTLAAPDSDVPGALGALADRLGAGPWRGPASAGERPTAATGPLDVATLGRTLAALQPEGAVIVDEGATSGAVAFAEAAGAPPHSWLMLTGGAIGQGLPCAVGAAVACPDRKVVALQADGSGLYTLQSLWTMASQGLDVTVVVCANRSYRILQFELARAGIAEPGPNARAMVDLTNPEMSWVSLARGFGVPGARVDTAEDLARELARGLAEPGPFLVEALL